MLVVYRPGHHCDLHSSPTRRSSDLFFTERFLPGFLATDNTRRMVYALVWRNANREKEGRDHFYAPYPGHPADVDFVKFYQHPFTRFNDGLPALRSEEHTSELQSRGHLVCRLLLEKKKQKARQ